MSLKDFARHMILSFFIVFSGIIFSTYFVMLFFSAEFSINRDIITGYVFVAFLTNSVQLILYTKKELSRWQIFSRIAIAAIIVVSIVLIASYYLRWFVWNIYNLGIILTITVSASVIVVIVATMLAKQTRLNEAVFSDSLTKAYNRRYFMEVAANELKNCIKYNREFSLITFDIDHFKLINDNYGHGIGDEVLKVTIARTKHVLKSETVVARLGGEEFIVLLTDKWAENARDIAWRIQNNLASRPFEIGNFKIEVTASFGIASKKTSALDLGDIIANSDKALYKAKASGRNTVVYYDCDVAKHSPEYDKK